jgi:hypothetical protein
LEQDSYSSFGLDGWQRKKEERRCQSLFPQL